MFVGIVGNLKKHWLVIVGGLALATLILSPLILFPLMSKGAYQGINAGNLGSDELDYLARGKDVLEGHGLGNPILREGKDRPDYHHAYTEYWILAPVKWLGLANTVDITTIYDIYTFVGVFLLILLIYRLVLQLSPDKLLAATAAFFVVGGYMFVIIHLPNISPFTSDFNLYGRPVFPLFSSLVFFIYLNILLKVISGSSKKYLAAAAIIFGLSFYIYFFNWSFSLALNASLAAVYLWKHDWAIVKKVTFITAVGLIIGSYNLYDLWVFIHSDLARQYAYFFMEQHNRVPVVNKLSLAITGLFALFSIKHRNDRWWWLIASMIVSGWLAFNQQIFTNTVLQPQHYFWYFVTPTTIIAGLYMLWRLAPSDRYRQAGLIILLILPFVNTALRQYRGTLTTFPIIRREQDYRPLIDYLKKDSQPGVILASNDFYGHLFIVYTNHDLFWNERAPQFFIPADRLKDALFVYLYLHKDARNSLADFINKEMANPTGANETYRNLYINLEGYYSGLDSDTYVYKSAHDDQGILAERSALIAQLDRQYRQLARDGGISAILKKYGVNYIAWDAVKNPEWDLTFFPNLKAVASSDGVHLYALMYN